MPNLSTSADSTESARIKKLSPLLINQLAAGEVVTRPATVVKELLENAIDAHATQIEIHITQGGMGMIEVVDNGVGIHPDDMGMAITRHATSKVADVAHLQGISTLGFRGEALAACAAVSRLSLSSSYDDSGVGRQLQVVGVLAEAPQLIPITRQRGTTVRVKDLYFNVPARRGNLKSVATEFNHIEATVRDIALAHADITLTLFHDHKKRLALFASDLQSKLPLVRLEQALGQTTLNDGALEINIDLSSLLQQEPAAISTPSRDRTAHISGWLWPQHTAATAPAKLLYINGRLVKEALISNQLRQLASSAEYADLGYALYFELPQQWINVNVHPSKQRIKISALNNIMAHLSHSVRLMLNHNKQNSQSNDKPNIVKTNLPPQQREQTAETSPFTQYQERAVSAPKQPYRVSDVLKASTLSRIPKPVPAIQAEPVHHIDNEVQAETVNMPQCLSVITQRPNDGGSDDLPSPPWLLFCCAEQYMLISLHDWQQHMGIEGETQILPTAAIINEQLNTHRAERSVSGAHDWSQQMNQALSTQAFSVISTEQLLTFMLSSPSL